MAFGINTLGLYRPGDSLLHRAGAAVKLVGLLGLGAMSVWLQGSWWLVLVALAVVACCYLLAGFGVGVMAKQVRPMLWILAFTAAMNWWAADWQRAVSVVGMIATLVAAAALVTLTTPTTALVDVVVRAAAPLRRFGVDPERIGLTLLLGIRCVPVVAGLAREVREAQIARGAVRDIRAFAVPLLVRALRDADAIGEALVARGFDD